MDLPGHGEAGIDDILDKQNVLAGQCAHINVVDLHIACAAGAFVRLHADEVEGVWNILLTVVCDEFEKEEHGKMLFITALTSKHNIEAYSYGSSSCSCSNR